MAVQAFFSGGVLTVVVSDPTAPMDSGNNLKQLGIALHALDAGDCSVDICAQNSPLASPAPDNSRGYTAGHFALELEGHNVDYGTGSFIIQNVSDPATIDASLRSLVSMQMESPSNWL